MNQTELQTIKNPLGTDRIDKLILKFSIPAIIGMLVGALYNIVDQIFIGRKVGMLGIAATNVAFPLSTICIAASLLIGIGGASSFSLSLGKGDKERASHIAGNSIVLTVIIGLVIAFFAIIFLRPMLLLFGATETVMPYAYTYTLITSFGVPFLIFTTAATHLIRADQSPNYAMLCMVSGAVFNIVFDPIFLYVFDMGIEGVALATLLSQILTFVLSLVYLLFRFKSVPLRKLHFKPFPKYVKRIASLGMAACFNQLAMMVVQVALNNTLKYYGEKSVYGSDIPLASVGAISKVNILFLSIVIGIAQGCQPIYGYNYGAKQYDRVKKTYKKAVISATVISVAAFIIFQVFPRQVVGIFGENNEAYIRFSTRYLRIFMFTTFLNGVQPVTSNFFTSIGKAKMGVFLSLTRQVLFLLPLVLFLPILYGIHGVMYAGPVADGIAFIVAFIFVYMEMRHMGNEAR